VRIGMTITRVTRSEPLPPLAPNILVDRQSFDLSIISNSDKYLAAIAIVKPDQNMDHIDADSAEEVLLVFAACVMFKFVVSPFHLR